MTGGSIAPEYAPLQAASFPPIVMWSQLLIALPFVDRNPRRYWRQRPLAIGIGALVLAAIIILTVLEAITTPAQHLG